MPYITQDARIAFQTAINTLTPLDAGELNYIVSTIIHRYTQDRHSYAIFNEVIGVLECAKLEVYRRLIAPYEDAKCLENGDVFGYNVETKPSVEGD